MCVGVEDYYYKKNFFFDFKSFKNPSQHNLSFSTFFYFIYFEKKREENNEKGKYLSKKFSLLAPETH